jgi:hypothetical protein
MRIAAGVVGLMLAFAGAAFAADPNDFKPFTPKEGGFAISFPGKPEVSTSTTTTELGEVEMHQFVAKRAKDKETYALIYCDLPADLVKDADPEKLLDRLRDGGAASVRGRPAKENKIKLDANPGRELEVGGLGGTRLWRLYLVNGRLYQLIVTADSGRPSAERAKTFFGSFKLAKEPAAAGDKAPEKMPAAKE